MIIEIGYTINMVLSLYNLYSVYYDQPRREQKLKNEIKNEIKEEIKVKKSKRGDIWLEPI